MLPVMPKLKLCCRNHIPQMTFIHAIAVEERETFVQGTPTAWPARTRVFPGKPGRNANATRKRHDLRLADVFGLGARTKIVVDDVAARSLARPLCC